MYICDSCLKEKYYNSPCEDQRTEHCQVCGTFKLCSEIPTNQVKPKPVPKDVEKEVLEFIKKETEERDATLWADKYRIKPCLIDEIDGDGLQVIYVEPIDTRPNYYVLRIDSNRNIKSDGFNFDQLLCMIEDECGSFDKLERVVLEKGKFTPVDEYDTGERYREDEDDEELQTFDEVYFPMLHWSGGCWGTLKHFGSPVLNHEYEEDTKVPDPDDDWMW